MKFTRVISTVLLLTVAGAAQAHPGHGADNGLINGLLHPLLGVDHLLVMLTVGFWSLLFVRQTRTAAGEHRTGGGLPGRHLLVPAVFIGVMLIGAVLGAQSGMLAGVMEQVVFASVIVMALLVSGQLALPGVLLMPMIALFALFHGVAHGSEATGSLYGYMAGFTLTTAVLLFTGYRLARFCELRGMIGASGKLLGLGLLAGAGSLLLFS